MGMNCPSSKTKKENPKLREQDVQKLRGEVYRSRNVANVEKERGF